MTRRERMLLIIENMGDERASSELAGMMSKRGRLKRFELLTDAAIDELAGRLVASLRLQHKMNAENRRIAAARVSDTHAN